MNALHRKLNLGCGRDIRPGWTNLDVAALPGVDVVHDLNQLPLPFEDDTFDEILCLDVLEHVDYVPLLRECLRLLAKGGKLTLEVPHYTSSNNYVDPTHRNRFSIKTFAFFCRSTYEWEHRGAYYFDFAFERLDSRRILFDTRPALFWNYLVDRLVNKGEKYQYFYEATGLSYLCPARNIRVTLEK